MPDRGRLAERIEMDALAYSSALHECGAQPQERSTAMEKKLKDYLRELARRGQYGHSRTPRDYYMGAEYCSFYWDNRGVVPDHATWQRVAALLLRYRRFVVYCTETLQQWQEIERIHFADNSVEAVQRSQFGTTRRVMLVAPHGDVCY